MNDAIDHSLATWRRWHEAGYFPKMKQHKDWRVYPAIEEPFLSLMAPAPDDVALEIGCGYGQRMIPLAPLVKWVSGFDIHATIIEKARALFAQHGVANAGVLLADGRRIPYVDSSFSLVYSISVFQHMPRALVATYMRETARVLRPDGRALFHFRLASGKGTYAEDIGPDHKSEWSVGWTLPQAVETAKAAGLATYHAWDNDLDAMITMARRA